VLLSTAFRVTGTARALPRVAQLNLERCAPAQGTYVAQCDVSYSQRQADEHPTPTAAHEGQPQVKTQATGPQAAGPVTGGG